MINFILSLFKFQPVEKGSFWLSKDRLYKDRYCSIDLIEITEEFNGGNITGTHVHCKSDNHDWLPMPPRYGKIYGSGEVRRWFRKIDIEAARSLGFIIP